ncbi:MAG: hypothetical protein JWM80_4204 [Cyanobacteria bacterium RYN_339]|nr:hypothetical protein [Cyanobacteria bacterium RYN_339]
MLTTTTLAFSLLLAAAPPAETPPKDPAAAVILNLACTPICLGPGVGYVYAGDPFRGSMVWLGMWGAVYGGALTAGFIEYVPVWLTAASGHPLSIIDPGPTMIAGAVIGFAGYMVWSSYDVFQTTEKANRERRDHFPR